MRAAQLHESTNTPLQQYKLLSELAGGNQTLFYYVLINNLEELAPIIYKPVVGEACTKFDRIYRCAPPRATNVWPRNPMPWFFYFHAGEG